MRKIILPVMIAAIILALYEQSKPQPNLYFTIAGIVVFMLGMMWLSSKTPSKNQDKNDDDVQ